jgi:fructokinase
VPSEQALQRLRPLLERAALLKLAAEEADWISACRDPRSISASLPQHPAVVVTDGDGALSWWLGGQAGMMSSFPVPVTDTTGAGDAFLAGLLHRLCRDPAMLASATQEQVLEAMRFAAACGALVCSGAGAIDPQPSEARVQAFLESAA